MIPDERRRLWAQRASEAAYRMDAQTLRQIADDLAADLVREAHEKLMRESMMERARSDREKARQAYMGQEIYTHQTDAMVHARSMLGGDAQPPKTESIDLEKRRRLIPP